MAVSEAVLVFVSAVLHAEDVSCGSSRLGILVYVRYLASSSCVVPPVACSFHVSYYCSPGQVRVHVVLSADQRLPYPRTSGASRTGTGPNLTLVPFYEPRMYGVLRTSHMPGSSLPNFNYVARVALTKAR